MSKNRTDQTIPDCPPDVLFSLCNRASILLSHHVEPPKYQLLIPVSSICPPLGIIKRSQKSLMTVCCAIVTALLLRLGDSSPGREPRKTFVDILPCRPIPFRSVSYAVVPGNHPSLSPSPLKSSNFWPVRNVYRESSVYFNCCPLPSVRSVLLLSLRSVWQRKGPLHIPNTQLALCASIAS